MKSSKKILIVRYEGNPFAVRMSKVIITLLECGFDIDILIPLGKKGIQTYRYSDGRCLDKIVNIYYFPTHGRFFNYLNRSSLLYDYFFESRLEILLKEKKYIAILVKDSHKLSAVFRVAKRTECQDVPIICDMYENAIEQHRDYCFRFASFQRKIITRLFFELDRLRVNEEIFLPKCKKIFVVVDEMKSYLINNYNINESKISVVENVELLEQYDKIAINNFKFDDIKSSTKVVSYVGNVGPHRGIENFLKSIKILNGCEKRDIVFVIVGVREDQERYFSDMANNLGVKNNIIIKRCVSHDDSVRWIKRSQVGIIPHLDTGFIRTTIPNKLFQYMAASAYIISSNVIPLSRIVNDVDCGCLFTCASPDDLAIKINFSLENNDLILSKGRKGRERVDTYYNWRKRSVEYTEYFSNLL